MTLYEAHNYLENFQRQMTQHRQAYSGKLIKANGQAILALEKQMPKKITHEATLYKCCTCPNCKNVVDKFEKWGESTVRITYKYCYFCGQALDWSDIQTEKDGEEE